MYFNRFSVQMNNLSNYALTYSNILYCVIKKKYRQHLDHKTLCIAELEHRQPEPCFSRKDQWDVRISHTEFALFYNSRV